MEAAHNAKLHRVVLVRQDLKFADLIICEGQTKNVQSIKGRQLIIIEKERLVFCKVKLIGGGIGFVSIEYAWVCSAPTKNKERS